MLRQHLPAFGWDLRGLDRAPLPDDDPIPMVVGDITEPAVLDEACTGAEAVVHLAGIAGEAPWEEIRSANVDGTYQVFEAARRAGAGRIVYASSNHAAGFTRRPESSQLPSDTPLRPDTLYGVSKAFGEALGRYYFDRYGLRVACLRIGHCAVEPRNDRAEHEVWLSPGDLARLVDACLRSPVLTYAIVWGVSANAGRWWSLEEAERLGYHPVDDAGPAPESSGGPATDLVGRAFTTTAFGLDEVRDRS